MHMPAHTIESESAYVRSPSANLRSKYKFPHANGLPPTIKLFYCAIGLGKATPWPKEQNHLARRPRPPHMKNKFIASAFQENHIRLFRRMHTSLPKMHAIFWQNICNLFRRTYQADIHPHTTRRNRPHTIRKIIWAKAATGRFMAAGNG